MANMSSSAPTPMMHCASFSYSPELSGPLGDSGEGGGGVIFKALLHIHRAGYEPTSVCRSTWWRKLTRGPIRRLQGDAVVGGGVAMCHLVPVFAVY